MSAAKKDVYKLDVKVPIFGDDTEIHGFEDKEACVDNEIAAWVMRGMLNRVAMLWGDYTRNLAEKGTGGDSEYLPYCKLLVAPTGSGKTWSLKHVCREYIRLVGVRTFIEKNIPLIAIASSVKSTIPVSWMDARDDEEESVRESEKAENEMKAFLTDKKNGVFTDDEYDRVTLVYRSVVDNLKNNIEKLDAEGIKIRKSLDDNKLLPAGLRKRCSALLSAYDVWKASGRDDDLENLHKADSFVRKELREAILKGLRAVRSDHSSKKCLQFVRENKAYSFFEVLYPEIALPEKRIVFLTVSKAFDRCSPIVEPAGAFHNLERCIAGTLFIDESDQAYGTLRKKCVESMTSPVDYISLYNAFLPNIQRHVRFDDFVVSYFGDSMEAAMKTEKYVELRERYENGLGDRLGVRETFLSIDSEYGLSAYPVVNDPSLTAESDNDGWILFNAPYCNVTVLKGDGKRYAAFRIDKKKKKIYLFYQKDKPSRDNDFLIFVERLKSAVDGLFFFLAAVAAWKFDETRQEPRSCQRELLEYIIPDHMYFDEKQFGMNPHERILYNSSFLSKREGVLPSFVISGWAETKVAARGFRYQYTTRLYGNVESDRLGIHTTECRTTPESLVLTAGKKMNVLLVSATADVQCNVRNFDLDYLDAHVNDTIYPSQQETDEIAACHERMNIGSDKVAVDVQKKGVQKLEYVKESGSLWYNLLHPEGVDSQSHNSLGRLLFRMSQKGGGSNWPQGFFDAGCKVFLCDGLDEDEIKKHGNHIFQSIRMYYVMSFVIEFLKRFRNHTCPYALFFSSKLFKKNQPETEAAGSIITWENLCRIINYYLESHPLKVTVNGDQRNLSAEDFVFSAGANGLAEAKRMVQHNIESGLPGLIITSFQSAAVGQNFQMFVPGSYANILTDVGTVRKRKVLSNGAIEANVPMIGMDVPTHILFDVENKERSLEMRARKAGEAFFDILSIADMGEISPNTMRALVRFVLGGLSALPDDQMDGDLPDEEIINEDGNRLSAIMANIRKTDTVAGVIMICFIQALGRFNRVPTKFIEEVIRIYGDFRILKIWRDDRLLTHEMKALVKTVDEKEVLSKTKWNIRALETDDFSRGIILGTVRALRSDPGANETYESLKRIIVQNPCCDESSWLRIPKKIRNLWIATDGADSYFVKYIDSAISEDGDVRCQDISLAVPTSPGYTELSIHSTRIDEMLALDGFAEFLDAKGVPHSWASGCRYMLTPYAFTLYKGTIGEYFAEYVLGLPPVRFKLDRFGEEDWEYRLYEFFDYRFSGTNVLLDVKNWSSVLRTGHTREIMMPGIVKKAEQCGASRIVLVNCIGERGDTSVKTVPLSSGAEIKLLEVDGLCRTRGKKTEVNRKAVMEIMRFIEQDAK